MGTIVQGDMDEVIAVIMNYLEGLELVKPSDERRHDR